MKSMGRQADTSPGTTSLRIMVVEDSETELKLLTRLARQVGCAEVAPYGEPKAALALAFNEGCDLILVDYQMPGLGG